MGELTRPTVYQVLHVLEDDIQFEVYDRKLGHTKDIESLANHYVNKIEMSVGTLIIYSE